MSLRKVSYEAFVFSVFSRNREKTKPLTWRSVSSLLPSQAATNLTTSRHNIVAIQLSIKTSFTWQFESLRLILIHFRLAQVTRLRQMFKMSHTDLKQWLAQQSSAAAFPSFRTASERPAICLFASLSQHLRNSDVLTAKSALKSLGCPIAMSYRPLMLLYSNTELQPIIHRKRK